MYKQGDRLHCIHEHYGARFLVVAQIGAIEDWAAYISEPFCNSKNPVPQWEQNIEYVAENGNKIDEALARRLFPELSEYSYRW